MTGERSLAPPGRLTTTWVAGLLLWAADPALASNRGMCPNEHERSVLTRFGDRIAAADSAEEAQDLALSKLRVAHVALDRARSVLPGESEALADAELRLIALEDAVLAGTTPAEVAAPFEQMAALDGRCDYTTVEIVVIVVGFVLGILPGVIFLFLFC